MIKSKIDDSKRVVVTGLGVVSSLGIGWEEFWKNIMAGKSGISRITAFDTSAYDRHYAGEVKNFDPTKFMNSRRASQMGRASQMAIAASKLAIEDGSLNNSDLARFRVGVCMGTTMGEPQVMERLDERCHSQKYSIDSYSALLYPASSIPNNVAHSLKLKYNNIIFSNACAAGNYAVGYSYDLIRSGKVDFMLAGGADALSRIAFTGFSRLFAMAPQECQPFDKKRKGMMLGEGSGVLLIETLKTAKIRKATIYSEIVGYGMSCDGDHMTVPSVSGIARAIRSAVENSKLTIGDIDYISAHGTGTIENDRAECLATSMIFGKILKGTPMSSIKSMLGHTMGAAASLETIACCLAIKRQEIPPTINFKEKDLECDIDCVPNKGRNHKIKIALNNSQAFGGNNMCTLLSSINE